MTTKTVGNTIKAARQSLGVSQEELVSFTNGLSKSSSHSISRRHLSNVEIGASNLSLGKLNLITFALLKMGAR